MSGMQPTIISIWKVCSDQIYNVHGVRVHMNLLKKDVPVALAATGALLTSYLLFRSHRRNILCLCINPRSIVLVRTTVKICAFCRRGSRLTKVNAAVLGFVHVVITRASCCRLCISEAEIHAAKRVAMKRLENIVIVVKVRGIEKSMLIHCQE